MWKRVVLSVTTKGDVLVGLTGDVGDHDEDEEGVVVEGEVVLVGEGDGVQARLLHVWQRRVDRQQFPCHSHGIQHDEKGVPAARRNNKSLYDYVQQGGGGEDGWAALL